MASKMGKIDSECHVFNPEWTSKYFVTQVCSKAKCLIMVFHDTVSFINMSVIIEFSEDTSYTGKAEQKMHDCIHVHENVLVHK